VRQPTLLQRRWKSGNSSETFVSTKLHYLTITLLSWKSRQEVPPKPSHLSTKWYGLTILEDGNLNENLAALRFAVYTIRERVTYRTNLIKAMSLICVHYFRTKLRIVWRIKRHVQQFGRSWWRSQVGVPRQSENARALDNNLIVPRTSGHPK
jgi:hypothetical protein